MNRSRPIFSVEIDDTRIPDIGSLGAVIREVRYEEREDKPDSITIEVIRANQFFISDPRAEEGVDVRVSVGYPDDLTNLGKFRLKRPLYDFPSSGQIRFIFRGERTEEARLSISQERRQFKSKTDSEIVEIVAKEHGYKTQTVSPNTGKMISTITSTEKRPETTTVSNQTWMQFFQKKAKHYGFQVWIEGNVLHFGPFEGEQITTQGLPLILRWSLTGDGTLKSFSVKDDASGKAAAVKATGLDPTTGEAVSVTGDSEVKTKQGTQSSQTKKQVEETRIENKYVWTGRKHELMSIEIREGKFNRIVGDAKKTPKNIITTKEEAKTPQVTKRSPVQTVEGSPTLYIQDEALAEDKSSSSEICNAKSQAAAWSIEADAATVYGLPSIRKGRSVTIEGVGRFSGLYLITGSLHVINEGGYETQFTVKANRSNKPATISPAGEVKKTRKTVVTREPGKQTKRSNQKTKEAGEIGTVEGGYFYNPFTRKSMICKNPYQDAQGRWQCRW